MGKPYGDLPHSDPTRLTDSAEEYTAPSEAAMEFTNNLEAILETPEYQDLSSQAAKIKFALLIDAFAAQAVAAERAQMVGWLDFKIAAAQRAAEKVRQQDAYTSDYETYAEAITAAFNEVVEHLKQ